MRDWWPVSGFILFTIAVFGFVIWLEINAWNECLETNSTLYCLRVLGK